MKLRVTLVRSLIDEIEPHKRTARALGLRRPRQSRVFADRPAVRGMLRRISHLVRVVEEP